MKLSDKAIKDLRTSLRKHFGEGFDIAMTDEQINNIGILLLTSLVESLKIKAGVC